MKKYIGVSLVIFFVVGVTFTTTSYSSTNNNGIGIETTSPSITIKDFHEAE